MNSKLKVWPVSKFDLRPFFLLAQRGILFGLQNFIIQHLRQC